ncbi:hypothetical protein FN846DRAFT_933012 [Sphaerosporella brunnea]|uniref:Uncharacterized protein n=1 Tax=Sphaerosporella brunnea TaxID=1250544 RepID=A0A5J5F6M8_9PEZI|nr:hypothetical protein FN846DRAFT_933012 [Sphaerosporella brunnea]
MSAITKSSHHEGCRQVVQQTRPYSPELHIDMQIVLFNSDRQLCPPHGPYCNRRSARAQSIPHLLRSLPPEISRDFQPEVEVAAAGVILLMSWRSGKSSYWLSPRGLGQRHDITATVKCQRHFCHHRQLPQACAVRVALRKKRKQNSVNNGWKNP